jgi:YD repeat-containing protein
VQTSDGYGHVTQYKYDAAGRLNQIFAPNFDTLTYLHDRVGRVVEQRFGSGGSRLMEWNPDSTLKSVKTTNSAGTELTSNTYTYTYTGHGERAAQTGTVNGQAWSWSYQHDQLGRLLLDNGPYGAGFRYDAFDNRQQRISSVTEFAIHDAANRLVEIRSGSATGALRTVAHHDADGQLVRLCDIRTGGTLSGSGASCTATGAGARQLALTWDASGRLSQAVVNGTTHSYTYDHADRRLSINLALALRPDVRPAHRRRATPCRIAERCPA